MKKKIISAILASAMILSLCAQGFAEVEQTQVDTKIEKITSTGDGASSGGGASGGSASSGGSVSGETKLEADKTVTYGSEGFDLAEVFGEAKLISSNENVLTIDKNNKVIPVGVGNAYVYAENEDKKYTVTVEPAAVEAGEISVWSKAHDGTTDAKFVADTYSVKSALAGDEVYIDTKNAKAEFESADVGTGIKVSISGLELSGADAGTYALASDTAETTADIADELTAAMAAGSIKEILQPRGDKKLNLPTLDGFDIQIASTGDKNVITTDGDVMAYGVDKTVDVVLEVTKQPAPAPSVEPSEPAATDEPSAPAPSDDANKAEDNTDAEDKADTPTEEETPAVQSIALLADDDSAKTKSISVTVLAVETADITVAAEHGTVTGEGSYQMGDDVELTATADEGYVFEGWYAADEFIGRDNPWQFKAERVMNLKANFISKDSKKVTVTTQYRGRTAEIKGGGEFSFGDTVTLSLEDSTYFRYWEVDGAKVSEKAEYAFTATEDVTVTAVMLSTGGGSLDYNYTYHTVNFETNGGNAMSSVKVARNTVMKMPEDPVRTGYRFTGWYSDEKLTKKYTFRDRVLEDMTLYAAWAKNSNSGSGNSGGTVTNKDVPYTDVSEKDWYYDAVKYMYQCEIMKGMSDTRFEPNTTLTRAMFVTVLYRAAGSETAQTRTSFKDVGQDMWYTKAVAWAVANGIAAGYSDSVFAPDDLVTREQMAAMIYRYAKYRGYDMSGSASISGFADAGDVSEWALAAVKWAVDVEIISGMSESTLVPGGTATRAQCASMIKRCIDNLDFMKVEENN